MDMVFKLQRFSQSETIVFDTGILDDSKKISLGNGINSVNISYY